MITNSPIASPSLVRATARAGLVSALAATLGAADHYVAASGNDGNPGTLSAPFQHINHAAQVAHAGDTVWIRGGTYRETVTPASSGASGAPIRFVSYNGEAVTVSGADPVGGWSLWMNAIWKAPMGWKVTGSGSINQSSMDQVLVDGRRLVEARWPNSTDLSHPNLASVDSVSSMALAGSSSTCTINDAALPSGVDWSGAIVHIVPGKAWYGQTGSVRWSWAGGFSLLFQDIDNGSATSYMRPIAGNRYYLTGKLAALDAAGEWFHDTGAGQLYLWAPAGDSPANHLVEAKRRLYAFELSNRSWITVQGLRIVAASIDSGSSSHLTLDHLDIEYPSQFLISPGAWDHQGDSGVRLVGSDLALTNSTVAYSSGEGVWAQGARITVDNCVIHDCDEQAYDMAAVDLKSGPHTVSNCTIYNAGRSLIKHANSWQDTIVHNDLHHGMLQTLDGGATYTYGTDCQGTLVAWNRVHDMHTLLGPTSVGFEFGSGIYLDHLTRNMRIHHNAVWSCGGANIHLNWSTASMPNNVDVFDNTLWDGANPLIGDHGNGTTGWYNVRIWNNLWNHDIYSRFVGASGVSFSHDLQVANGGFVDQANGNYQLAAGSPAIDKGTAIAGITDGFKGAAPDCGAYEYGATAWSAGAHGTAMPPPQPPAANQAPTVSLTSPAAGASIAAKASFQITADAADADGSVAKVEFWLDGALIHTELTAPYGFSWSIAAAGTHSLVAKAFDNLGATTSTAARSFTVTGGSTGTGLAARYYDNSDFTGTTVSRVDATVSFDWGTGAPAAGIGADTFSARWSGQVSCPTSETYTFSTVSDDGARLWIDGKLVIDNWTLHTATENSGSLALSAGMHTIRLDYFENGGYAVMKLSWATPTRAKAIIPQGALYPAALAAAEFALGPSAPVPVAADAPPADGGHSRCGLGGGIAIALGLMLIARRRQR